MICVYLCFSILYLQVEAGQIQHIAVTRAQCIPAAVPAPHIFLGCAQIHWLLRLQESLVLRATCQLFAQISSPRR